MRTITVFTIWFWASFAALAAETDTLTSEDATGALTLALTQGIDAAVGRLGVTNGFLDNPKVKITLPGSLQKAEGLMRSLGISKHADNLILAMNRAAETATAEAKPLLLDALQNMSVDDAKGILAGGNDSATQYFRSTSSEALSQKFLPIVKNATDQAGLLKRYNEFAGKGAKFGLVPEKHANIENYVTQKTLDGIFLIMAEEERAIRSDTVGRGNKMFQKILSPSISPGS
jgi:hypothetical protein